MKPTSLQTARLLAAAALLALAGCVRLATVDATADARYRSIVGREYELREPFRACGVKHDFPQDHFDEVAIMPPPGIGGRYIVDLGLIPAGSRIRVVGVTNHRSKLFPKTEYVVVFPDHRIPGADGKPIRLYNVALWPLYEQPVDENSAPQLSARYFRPLVAPKP